MLVKDNLLYNSNSFHLAYDNAMEALKDDGVSLIAVWGMAGVGKTTLIKEVAKRVREVELFHKVIGAVVPDDPNPAKKIQDRIADLLEFKISTEMERAEELRLRLKNEESILIIFDGVWDALDLKNIGIPHGEDHKGCKILLTTRCKQVCISMGIKNVIQFDALSNEEAFGLLKMSTGDPGDSVSPTNTDAATEIANGCQGLPLAILELGRRLRDHAIDVEVLTRYAWGLGLYEGTDSIKDVRSKVREDIGTLKSSCLLLDHGEMSVKMHNLVRHCAFWIASAKKISFMVGPKIGLKEWQKVSDLPEKFRGEELEILSLDGNGSRKISSALMEGMKSLKVFTLRYGHLSASALESLTNLRTLRLVCCQLKNISSLGKLEKLEILSFRGSDISELPDEIGRLNYLRLLDLLDCQKLQKVPDLNLIRRLSQLEELYFNFPSFQEWWTKETSIEGSMAAPSEPSRIIPSYSLPPNLQTYEITIKEDGSLNEHDISESRTLRVTVVSLDTSNDISQTGECLHLNHVRGKQAAVGQSAKELRDEDGDKPQAAFHDSGLQYTSREDKPTLTLSILTLELIDLPQLTCTCNRRPTDYVSVQILKVVRVQNCNKLTSLFSSSLAAKMISLEQLLIDGCHSLQQISLVSVQILKVVRVQNCNKLTSLFSSSLAAKMISLEQLLIDGCHSLQQIISDTNSPGFPSLVTLEIRNCNVLKYVFKIAKFSFPRQLMVVKISGCPQLNRVIEVIGNEQIELPQLQGLALKKLKSLTAFCSGEPYIGLPSLEQLEVEACPQLRICDIIERCKVKDLCLFHVENKLCEEVIQLQGGYFLSCLKKFVLNQLKLEVIWKDPSQIVTLQNLSQLEVFRCNELSSIFSVLLARNLPQLSRLDVRECAKLKQIVSEDPNSSSSMVRHKPEYFPNLEEICIMKCSNLRNLFPISVCRLPKLKKLQVKGASELNEIFAHDTEAKMTNYEKQKVVVALTALEVLSLENLPNFIRFTTVGYFFVFPALTSLKVCECPKRIIKFSFRDDLEASYVCAEVEKSKLPNGGLEDGSIKMRNIQSDHHNNILWAHPSEKEAESFKKKTESNAKDDLVEYATQSFSTDRTISVPLEHGLFPYATTLRVGQEQINQIASFGAIDVKCILTYMSLLYKKLKEQNLKHIYGFIDPSRLSNYNSNIPTRAMAVRDALEKASPKQLFFAPYNSKSGHWQLIVINPCGDTVYFFDSISRNPEGDIRKIIEIGLRLFNAQKKREDRKNTWKTIKGPRQPGELKHGFYIVMRYMKEIIENNILSISDKVCLCK
ncbi:hypothetical protein PTKIN_Ptkin14bG0063700 [Pterospermum kingtungense]